MKHRIPRNAVLAVAAAALVLAGTLSQSQGQAPVPLTEDAATRQLAADVLAQNKVMTDNQTRIEEKMAQLAESIRQARIYASRSGKGG